MECLSIYHTRCLTCKHFVDGAKVNNVKCHYSNGNKNCPAQEVKIVVTGKLKTMAKQLMVARSKLDYTTESEILKEIGKSSIETRKTFNMLLQELNDRG